MYGIIETINIIKGNNAKKNLKAREDALVVNEFLETPLMKKTKTL